MKYHKIQDPSESVSDAAASPAEAAAEDRTPRRRRFFNAKSVAYFGVLVALEIILLVWGSAIPVGPSGAMLNFSLLPIVLGAILLGPFAGMVLGLVSGIVILIMVAAGAQGVFSVLFLEQPVMIALICIIKTTAAGFVSGLLYRAIAGKNGKAAVFTASLAAPIVNTGVFILGCLCIGGTIENWWLGTNGSASSAFSIIIFSFVGINFFIEFAINLVLAPALSTVIRVAEKRFQKKRKA